MEENMVVNEVVNVANEAAETAVTEVAEKAIAEVQPTAPAKTGHLWKDLAIGAGGALVGAGLEYVTNRWIVPKVKEAWENHKAKKAEKKAAKEAKKAKKAKKKSEPEAAAPATEEKPVEATEVETKVE